MLVELTVRRRAGVMNTYESPIDGIRVLAALPPTWNKDLRQTIGEIVIRVQTDEEVTAAQLHAEVDHLLDRPETGEWELVTCQALAAAA